MLLPTMTNLIRALRTAAFLICAIFPALGQAQNPYFNWATKAGGTGDDFSRGIATDASGNCYVTGSFSGTATFGSTNVSSTGGYDIFIARYDAAGQFVWVRQAGSASAEIEEGRGVALDTAGNVYVTGGFAGTASFGGTNLVSSGGLDIFLAKYTATGELLWARNAGGAADFEYGLSIAFDPVGNVFVTGQFQGAASFGSTNLVGRGGFDVFLAKYDLAGNLIWLTQAGGGAGDFSRSVVVDGAGNSYIAGWSAGDITFGANTTITNHGSTDAFVAKYDSQGRLRLVTFVGSPLGEQAYGYCIDSATNGYLLAWLEGAAVNQLGLYKFDSGGNSIWTRGVRVNSDANARGGLAVDSAGNSYFTSQFSGTALFDTRTLLSQGASDTFVAKYDTAGNLIWLKHMLGSTTEEGRAIAVDPSGNACLTGWFMGSMAFDSQNLTTSGAGDIFVTRLDPPPRLTVNQSGEQVVLSWPKAATGFQVQQTGVVPSSNQWQTVASVPVVVGNQQVVTNALASTNTFFRLLKQ
jgi:hypothetical protein